MCEIQFIQNFERDLNHEDIQEFFKLMMLGSINNNCAFGFFNKKICFKRKGFFNLKNFEKNKFLLQDNFLIGHNRLATHGSNEKKINNHPFVLNNFVLVHNGIISNYEEIKKTFDIKTNIETDSYTILWLIDYYFNKSNKKTQENKIKYAIKKACSHLCGSFSVFLYDKTENKTYYFKDACTNFSFCLLDNKVLIGSTIENNLRYLFIDRQYKLNKKIFNFKKVIVPQSNKIYLIDKEEILKEIGIFEEETETSYENVRYADYNEDKNYYDKSNWDNNQNMLELNSEQKNTIIEETFQDNLGYIPSFTLLDEEVLIDYDKKTYQDIKTLFDNVDIKNSKIRILIEDFSFYT